jgi:hypothetical protein
MEGLMSEQYKAALLRATPEAIATAALAAVAVWTTTRNWEATLFAFFVPLLTVIAGRGAVEGQYDTTRAKQGKVKPGDVTPNGPANAPFVPDPPAARGGMAQG